MKPMRLFNHLYERFVRKIDGGFVPPFDHSEIWAGHSTLIDEVVTQIKKPAAIVVAVGGGGLSCRILEGIDIGGTMFLCLA
ncbi:pyridoxal-phosphate dependent enzyme [Candidatus Coxiella mudrowiae]|uniref:pyridoxal-phosphate dependent enzyme n=1 Tax=Candidatus Coxiella mudrowiae TaxID=2054173 RepID=UPI00069D2D48|nr:pyridoxal-phosphate dependent enzyme [Candidatus Coxiella mudrowiae]